MPYKNKYAASSPIILAPWIFIIIVAVLAYFAINRIDRQTFKEANESSQEYISASGLNQCIASLPEKNPVTSDQMKSCLQGSKTTAQVFDQAVKPRLDELTWLLTIIAAIGAFFAIAQGAAAWFSADVYTRQADDSLKKITHAQDAIKARYPLFEHVESIRKQAIASLNNVFTSSSKAPDSWAGNTEALDWKDNLFRRLGVETRQLLLSVESFASIDLDPSFSSDEHAEILRKFSLFYRAKFLYEDGVSQGSFGDLERAEAYMILAGKKKPDFTIRNDLGSLYGTIYQFVKKTRPANQEDADFYLRKSEDAFSNSLTIEPGQQRAHYSLAVIHGRHRKQYKKAADELQLALRHTVWQREPSDYMKTIMYYNMACYQSRLLQESWDKTNAITVPQCGAVTSYLDQAAHVSYVRQEFITTDFDEAEGDFTGLLAIATPELQTKMADLRTALEKNANQAEQARKNAKAPADPPNRKAAFTEAMRLLRNALTTHGKP